MAVFRGIRSSCKGTGKAAGPVHLRFMLQCIVLLVCGEMDPGAECKADFIQIFCGNKFAWPFFCAAKFNMTPNVTQVAPADYLWQLILDAKYVWTLHSMMPQNADANTEAERSSI